MTTRHLTIPALTAVAALLAKPTGKNEEKLILQHLESASAPDLDTIVKNVDLDRLLGAMDDRWFGPDYHEAALVLLTKTRVQDLGLESRARLIGALQRGKTTYRDEEAIRDLFLATQGTDLTRLKNLIDSGGDHRDLQQLIHHDIDKDSIRGIILAHITQEGSGIASRGTKLLSDIDDTVYANWKDERYPKKTVYPGVRQFYIEIDETPGIDTSTPTVTFLTARPRERTGKIENDGLESLEARGFKASVMLSGSITHLSNAAIAEKKHENFLEYTSLYPEYGFIFVGDSGQGDAALAAKMRVSRPLEIRGLFIHRVDQVSETERADLAKHGIHLFDTYAGAAASAFEMGLIDDAALRRVAVATVLDMKKIDFETRAQREARLAELTSDLARVNALLAPGPAVVLDG